jgi:hypothetical protein
MVAYAPKIVLQLPMSDPNLLDEFVESCLRDGVVLICVWGPDCGHVEDLIDEIVVGNGADYSRFIVTTSHGEESLADVIEFAENWTTESDGGTQVVSL